MATKGINFAGRTIKIPGAYGFGDASDMVEISLGALNVLMLVGTSEGGEPNKPLFFSAASKERALRVIRGGDLHAAMKAAWTPSPADDVNGADVIVAVRVNPATQAQTTFLDIQATPAEAFDVKARDWGSHGNENQVGTLAGVADPSLRRVIVKKISDGVDMQSPDLGEVLMVAYNGDGTCTIDVNVVAGKPNLVVSVTGATDGSAGFTVDLTTKAVKTIAKLAAFIQAQAKFNVKVLGAAQMKSEWLDPIAAPVAVAATGTKLRAVNGACVDWINANVPSALAEFKGNAASVALVGPVFLTGGTDGVPTQTHWQQAFNKLANEPGYILVPCTDDEAIHASALDHALAMSDIKIKRRRTAYFGHGLGDVVFAPDGSVDITNLAARIFKLNSDRCLMATPGVVVTNDEGEDELYPAWLTAAMLAGLKCGAGPQESLTGKYLKVNALEGDYDPTMQEALIDAAASYVTKVPNKGFEVGIGQLAQLRTTNTLASEPSVLHVADTLLTNLENTLSEKYKGVAPTSVMQTRLGQVKRDVIKLLKDAATENWLVGGLKDGVEVAPFRNVKVSFSNRTYQVEFEASIAEPGNYITIMAHWSAVQGVAA